MREKQKKKEAERGGKWHHKPSPACSRYTATTDNGTFYYPCCNRPSHTHTDTHTDIHWHDTCCRIMFYCFIRVFFFSLWVPCMRVVCITCIKSVRMHVWILCAYSPEVTSCDPLWPRPLPLASATCIQVEFVCPKRNEGSRCFVPKGYSLTEGLRRWVFSSPAYDYRKPFN